MDPIKTCIDRPLNPNQRFDTRLAGQRAKFWPEHQRQLHVRFLNGKENIWTKVIKAALEWEEYAGIEFLFDNHPRSQIRIAFDPDGCWSYIGTDALSVGQSQPTMNFGWFTDKTDRGEIRRVVLHEFGHLLGMVHEHQSPNVKIPWNREAVYRFYAGPPNYWSRDLVNVNVFAKFDRTEMEATKFDSESIMLYPVPEQLTVGNFSVGWNDDLSELDKKKIAETYPRVRVR